MIFIIDSGSTKCDWIAIDSKTGDQLFDKQRTKGLNPAIISKTEAFEIIKENTVIYKNKQKVIILAKKVKNQSDKYKSQLKKCQKRLNKNKYIIF